MEEVGRLGRLASENTEDAQAIDVIDRSRIEAADPRALELGQFDVLAAVLPSRRGGASVDDLSD